MEVVRWVAAALGGVLAIVVTVSVVRSLIVPRTRPGGIFVKGQRMVDEAFSLGLSRVHDYRTRDRFLAGKAPVLLLVQLAAWLLAYLLAFGMLLWPHDHDVSDALGAAGSSMFTLGYVAPHGAGVGAIDIIASICGLVVITLQIAYLPSLYGAFNRRETLVSLLESRAGLPPWGPELLARTKFGIVGDKDDLPQFYAAWEGWAADVAESHSNYPILVQFRSPHPMASWLIGLLAVMDSAALMLAVAPSRDRIEPRLCLRMGFTCLRQIADSLGIPHEKDPDPDNELLLSFDEFVAGIERLRAVNFPVERTPEEAWPHFRGWRVNYESIAYSLASMVDAVPGLWSGPRRWPSEPIAPFRPANRMPSADKAAKIHNEQAKDEQATDNSSRIL